MAKTKHLQKSKPTPITESESKSPIKAMAAPTVPSAEPTSKGQVGPKKKTNQTLTQNSDSVAGAKKKTAAKKPKAAVDSTPASATNASAPGASKSKAPSPERRNSKQDSVIALLEQGT